MPKVELIYDRSCPNVIIARENLLRAFSESGVAATWTEWDRDDRETPAYARNYGSPAVLVEGRDVSGFIPASDANCCRVYPSGGAPSAELIAQVLRNSAPSGKKVGYLGAFALGPGVGAALLAKAACPFCYPAIAGILSFVGLGFMLSGRPLMMLAAGLVSITLTSLGYRARSRRGYGPLLLGCLSTGLAFAGRSQGWDLLFNSGLAGLVIASFWNLLPKRSCGSYVPASSTPSRDASGAQ